MDIISMGVAFGISFALGWALWSIIRIAVMTGTTLSIITATGDLIQTICVGGEDVVRAVEKQLDQDYSDMQKTLQNASKHGQAGIQLIRREYQAVVFGLISTLVALVVVGGIFAWYAIFQAPNLCQ